MATDETRSRGVPKFEIRQTAPQELHPLRRRVLRDDDPIADVTDPRDDDITALHLGGFIDDRLVVCASLYNAPPPLNPQMTSCQLRYVATDFGFHHKGFAAAVLAEAEQCLRGRGVEQLWANARDSALGFYQAIGWSVIAGSEHLGHPPSYLPHTVIFKVLHRT